MIDHPAPVPFVESPPMPSRSLLGCLLLGTCLSAQALDTHSVPETTLLSLGASLASSAGSSQWQQLWKRSRDAGYLTPQAQGAWFTAAQATLPELVKATLAEADSVTAQQTTQALYRRDFHPQEIGRQGETRLYALCLRVDWRALGSRVPYNPLPHMKQVSLLEAQPCP